MIWTQIVLTLCLCGLGLANENRRGYPLLVGSFEDVGKSKVNSDVLPVQVADQQLTDWTKGCPADAFVLIRDSNPFQLTGLKKLQRAAENSLTTGSFLTDFVVNMREFSLDLEEYCEAELIEVNTHNISTLERKIDARTRIYYIEFEAGFSPQAMNETLTGVFAAIPTPFVTVVYTSTFMQSQPVLRSIQLNPKRHTWQRQKLRHNRDKIAPVIAPLFNTHGIGHSAPEPKIDLPDNFFFTLLVGSVLAVGFLIYRDLTAPKRKEKSMKAEEDRTKRRSSMAASESHTKSI